MGFLSTNVNDHLVSSSIYFASAVYRSPQLVDQWRTSRERIGVSSPWTYRLNVSHGTYNCASCILKLLGLWPQGTQRLAASRYIHFTPDLPAIAAVTSWRNQFLRPFFYIFSDRRRSFWANPSPFSVSSLGECLLWSFSAAFKACSKSGGASRAWVGVPSFYDRPNLLWV